MRISDWSSYVCSSDLFGTTLATLLNLQIAGRWFVDQPEVSWRYVFLCGLIPAAVAFGVRLFVKEPERWTRITQNSAPPRLGELFSPQFRRIARKSTRLNSSH